MLYIRWVFSLLISFIIHLTVFGMVTHVTDHLATQEFFGKFLSMDNVAIPAFLACMAGVKCGSMVMPRKNVGESLFIMLFLCMVTLIFSLYDGHDADEFVRKSELGAGIIGCLIPVIALMWKRRSGYATFK